MARGFMDGLRRGRDEAIAARGRRRPAVEAEPDADTSQVGDVSWEDAYRALEAQHEETKQLVGELADTVELLRARVVELIGGAEPLAKVLRLPGAKTWLLQRFHPDKYPEADERQSELLNDAIKAINAAYAVIEKERQASAD
jgi:hypothetical protein